MNTIALTVDTAPTRQQSRIRSVFSRSRPQSSALTINAPLRDEAPVGVGDSLCSVRPIKGSSEDFVEVATLFYLAISEPASAEFCECFGGSGASRRKNF